MSLSAIMHDRPNTGYRILPEGSRIDDMFQHLDDMRRHETMRTYRLTMFVKDITKRKDSLHFVNIATLPLHLRSVRAGESEELGKYVSMERVREMILELHLPKETLEEINPDVVADLGLATLVR